MPTDDPGPRTWRPDASGPVGSEPPPDGSITIPAALGGPPPPGSDVRYRRDGLLGKGGMGIVYLARDHQLGRSVALKEAARGGEIAARLAREAQITAGLEHPGIVTVHDSGVTDDGRPFYTMRLLRGRSLSSVLAERKTLAERLGLVRHYLDACNALGYAHAEGVVHRDVKPANIMVGGFGETQVVDWGLAARIGEPGSGGDDVGPADATRTRTGAVMGTPAYMSPEQARGEPVDARADVWSLGAILYELLAGVSPRGMGSSDEVLALARAGAVPPVGQLHAAPPELVAIAERALAADAASRYPDAGALAVDVSAWLDGRPVEAHRYTPWELLVRLVRAWRAPLMVGLVAVTVLLVLIAAGTTRLAAERDRVMAAEKEVRAALVTSDGNLADALVSQARQALDRGAAPAAAVLAGHAVALVDTPEARGVLAAAEMESRPERLSSITVPECVDYVLLGDGDVLCVDGVGVSRIQDGVVRWSWEGAASSVRLDGPLALFVLGDRVVGVELESGVERASWGRFLIGGSTSLPVRPPDWGLPDVDSSYPALLSRFCPGSSPEGGGLSLAGGSWVMLCADGRVARGAIGDARAAYLPTGLTREVLSGVMTTLVVPEGDSVLFGGSKGRLARVDLGDGRVSSAVLSRVGSVRRMEISPDQTRVAVLSDTGDLEVRELPGLALVVRFAQRVRGVRFLPDGSLEAAASRQVTRWRLPDARVATSFRGPDGVTAAVYSPDGRHLATTHGRERSFIWELPGGRASAVLELDAATAKSVAFMPDGLTAWFALAAQGVPRLRPAPLSVTGAPVAGIPDEVLAVDDRGEERWPTRRILALSSGRVLALGYAAGWQILYDPRTQRREVLLGCPVVEWQDAGQSASGRQAVLVSTGGVVARLEPGPPVRCGASVVVDGAGAADVSESGEIVVGTETEVALLDAAGVERWRVPWPEGRLLDVAISGDGRWVAGGGTDRRARVWDARGQLRAVLAGHTERVASVDFRPDGRVLVTGSWDGTARLWGLDVLSTPAAELDSRAPVEWGLTVAEALEDR